LEETSKEHFVQHFVGKGTEMRSSSSLSSSHLENLQRCGLYHVPGEFIPVILLTVKNFLVIHRWNLSQWKL